MDTILEFAKSDLGVAIAWLCTVGSVFIGLLKARENRLLKQKITNILSSNIENSHDSVSQKGDKNIYTKTNTGGMNINM